jgi:hypothetical protein
VRAAGDIKEVVDAAQEARRRSDHWQLGEAEVLLAQNEKAPEVVRILGGAIVAGATTMAA